MVLEKLMMVSMMTTTMMMMMMVITMMRMMMRRRRWTMMNDIMNCTCWIILGNIYCIHKPPSPYSKENNSEGVKHK